MLAVYQMLHCMLFAGFLLALRPAQVSASETWVLDFAKANTKVDFHAGKLLDVSSENGNASGSLMIRDGLITGKAVVDIGYFKTGSGVHDYLLKNRFLEVAKFPKATFEIVAIKMQKRFPYGRFFVATFLGNLTIRGVTKTVSGIAKLTRNGSSLKGEVDFGTTITGHKIHLPKFPGVLIQDDVRVKVEFDGQLIRSSSFNTFAKK